MISTNGRSVGWREGLTCAILPVLIEVLADLTLSDWRNFGRFSDPDTLMRLVRLRDIVASHRPIGFVANDASGHGTMLHWSHLLDSFLLLLASPLQLFMPADAAQRLAGLLFGGCSTAAMGFACAWAVAPFADRKWRWIAPLAATLAPVTLYYGHVGVVHHHTLTIVVGVMSWGWAARIIAGQRGGVALGAWAAFGVWLTPEALPLSVLAFGALYVVWVEQAGAALSASMRAAGATMMVLTTVAWLVDPPSAGHRAVELDRLSIVFVALAAVFAMVASGVVIIEHRTRQRRWRLGWSLLFGLILGAAWVMRFPEVLAGPDTIMNDTEWHAFFDRIAEMQPVHDWYDGAEYLLPGLLGLLTLIWLTIRYKSVVLAYAAFGLTILVALASLHIRFSPYPSVAAALLAPIALTRIRGRWAAFCPPTAMVLLTVPLLMWIAHAYAEARSTADAPSCDVEGLTPILAPFGNAVVLANVNDSPALLYRTRLKTVGSLYHRNPAAFMRLWRAWRSRPGTAWSDERPTPEVDATEATLLIFCPTQKRSLFVRDLPADTLADWLTWGQIPRWLHEVARDPASGNIVYRIDR
jgi:hypothetical protein